MNNSLLFGKRDNNQISPNAVVTPLRKAASYEQRKTNLGSSP